MQKYFRSVQDVQIQRSGNGLTAVCKIDNLPPGEYVAFAFHDCNSNGKVDSNFVGMPVEPIGFSNGVRPQLFPIPKTPTWKSAAFSVQPGENRIRLSVRKFKQPANNQRRVRSECECGLGVLVGGNSDKDSRSVGQHRIPNVQLILRHNERRGGPVHRSFGVEATSRCADRHSSLTTRSKEPLEYDQIKCADGGSGAVATSDACPGVIRRFRTSHASVLQNQPAWES